MAFKSKRIDVASSGEILAGPLVSSDSVFAGAKDDVTVRVDRRSLECVWRIASNGLQIGHLVNDDLLSVAGREVRGVRSTVDGRLLWDRRGPSAGASTYGPHVAILTATAIELRHPATGELVRVVEVPGGVDEPGRLCGALWVLPSSTSIVRAVNVVTGRLEWERPLLDEMAPFLRAPRLPRAVGIVPGSEDLFVATHGGSTFGCSMKDGSIMWHAPVAVPYYWPTVDADHVYVLLFDHFIAIDGASGKILYDVRHPELGSAYRAKAGTIYKGRIAVPNESGHLAAFNLADGALVSLHEDKLPLWQTAEADGRLFVTTGDGKLLVFDDSIWGW